MIKTVIDPLSQTKAQMLRGEEMQRYFRDFLHPEQEQFMSETLALRAAPALESYSPLVARLRVSLGPEDAFARMLRMRCESAQNGAADTASGEQEWHTKAVESDL